MMSSPLRIKKKKKNGNCPHIWYPRSDSSNRGKQGGIIVCVILVPRLSPRVMESWVGPGNEAKYVLNHINSTAM